MELAGSIPIFQFSTEGLPSRERFDAWRTQLSVVLELDAPIDPDVTFGAAMDAAHIGSVVIGKRTWLNPERRVSHRIRRTAKRIRADGLDYYYLQLQQTEITQGTAGKRELNARPGDLFVRDLAAEVDYSVTSGDAIYMLVPRDLLNGDSAALHGHVMSGGLAGLLADYMRSLYLRMGQVSAREVPYVAQATSHLLRACLLPGPDALVEAEAELDTLRMQRVKRYIDAHLFDAELDVNRICRDVGLSRSTLYRLFESTAGVSHMIFQKRMRRAHEVLTEPGSPKLRIDEVASRYGFSSGKHFSRSFKSTFGYSPREACEHNNLGCAVGSSEAEPGYQDDASFGRWMRSFLQQRK